MIVSDRTEVLSLLERLVRGSGYRDVVCASSTEHVQKALIDRDWVCSLMLIDSAWGLPAEATDIKREYPVISPCIRLMFDVRDRVCRCHMIVMCNAQFINDRLSCVGACADDCQDIDLEHAGWHMDFRSRLRKLLAQTPPAVVDLSILTQEKTVHIPRRPRAKNRR